MKPTHTASLVGGPLIRVYETEKFWVGNKKRYRKHDGSCTEKKSPEILDLSSIQRLPDKVWLVKENKKYLVVKMDRKNDTIVLDNGNGVQFESKLSKVKGYQIVKEFIK